MCALPLPVVDIVVPAYNEDAILGQNIRRLHAHLGAEHAFRGRIVIADSGSSDGTALVGSQLAAELPEVRLLRLDVPGRGRALRAAWLHSDADIVAYMDADLSSDLTCLGYLIDAVASGQSDMAIGSRLALGARVKRSTRREVLSRGYNFVLRLALGAGFRDAQCGFKAMRREVASTLLPLVQDEGWFFDTELLVRAERSGFTVVELPVGWVERRTSTVKIARTVLGDLRGVHRLRRQLD